MAFENLLVETKGGIGWITVNRPEQMNALSMETVRELEVAVRRMGEDKEARVVAITGAGDRAFVAGADIAAMQAMTPAEAEEFVEQGHRAMRAIEGCGKAVIAAVNGFALGGGTELALACDLVVAAEEATFGLPEVTLGLYPGFGGTQRLPRAVGPMRARELIFTGRRLSAAEALAWGLANRVVPAAQLKTEVEAIAARIMANGPLAVAAAKRLIHEGMSLSLTDALEQERAAFPKLFHTRDLKEGLAAFLEKRKAAFTGS